MYLFMKVLVTMADAMLQPVQSAIAAEAARYETAAFGAHDGQLADDTSLTWLASHYDAQHCYSANQIHGYIRCPFGFYLERHIGGAGCACAEAGFRYVGAGQYPP